MNQTEIEAKLEPPPKPQIGPANPLPLSLRDTPVVKKKSFPRGKKKFPLVHGVSGLSCHFGEELLQKKILLRRIVNENKRHTLRLQAEIRLQAKHLGGTDFLIVQIL